MFDIDDCIPISGLQHLAFCQRQWGLIHIDQEWQENKLTAEGKSMHQRVDEGYQEFRKGVRQYSGLYVKSLEFGIFGRTDLVEAVETQGPEQQIGSLGLKGNWILYPVEFKRGKPKEHHADIIQLCAQALCLEEMTKTKVLEGAVFYGEIRKRLEVSFDSNLRSETICLIAMAHDLLAKGVIPPPNYQKHCRSCSMSEICMPNKFDKKKLEHYRQELLG